MSNIARKEVSIGSIISMLIDGFKTSLSKECRIFTIIPIIINIFVLSGACYFIYSAITEYVIPLTQSLPDWLSFLASLLSYLIAIVIIFGGLYVFSTVATIIASPFYGLLAERVEMLNTGVSVPDSSLTDILKDVPRIFKREIQKMMYYIPRLLVCIIVMLIPVINIVSPVLWLLLTSWMATIQYCDYAYANHKTKFSYMKDDLKANRLSSFIFGLIVSLLISIPVVNLFVPASAVCAGTKYYLAMQKNKGEE